MKSPKFILRTKRGGTFDKTVRNVKRRSGRLKTAGLPFFSCRQMGLRPAENFFAAQNGAERAESEGRFISAAERDGKP